LRFASLLRSACCALPLLALGCAAPLPPGALAPDDITLQKRSLESRRFSGISEADLLRASASVLQDLGFTIDESETKLGVIVASKTRSAKNQAEQVWKGVGCVLGALAGDASFCHHPIKDRQVLRTSLVVRPTEAGNGERHIVRIKFQRRILDSHGKAVANETLDGEKFYREFFDKLSKSVFLEGEKI